MAAKRFTLLITVDGFGFTMCESRTARMRFKYKATLPILYGIDNSPDPETQKATQ